MSGAEQGGTTKEFWRDLMRAIGLPATPARPSPGYIPSGPPRSRCPVHNRQKCRTCWTRTTAR